MQQYLKESVLGKLSFKKNDETYGIFHMLVDQKILQKKILQKILII